MVNASVGARRLSKRVGAAKPQRESFVWISEGYLQPLARNISRQEVNGPLRTQRGTSEPQIRQEGLGGEHKLRQECRACCPKFPIGARRRHLSRVMWRAAMRSISIIPQTTDGTLQQQALLESNSSSFELHFMRFHFWPVSYPRCVPERGPSTHFVPPDFLVPADKTQ
jgi:hypothetical protein